MREKTSTNLLMHKLILGQTQIINKNLEKLYKRRELLQISSCIS